MRMEINVDARSQYEEDVSKKYRSSACGPTAMASILSYFENQPFSIDMLYKKLHCTRLGLPAFFLIKYSRKLLGPNWTIQKINLPLAIEEIKQNRPVAIKFDRYFNWKFYKKPHFAYHWTVLTGIDFKEDGVFLILEDLGNASRGSRTVEIPYTENAHALTFVQIKPKKF